MDEFDEWDDDMPTPALEGPVTWSEAISTYEQARKAASEKRRKEMLERFKVYEEKRSVEDPRARAFHTAVSTKYQDVHKSAIEFNKQMEALSTLFGEVVTVRADDAHSSCERAYEDVIRELYDRIAELETERDQLLNDLKLKGKAT